MNDYKKVGRILVMTLVFGYCLSLTGQAFYRWVVTPNEAVTQWQTPQKCMITSVREVETNYTKDGDCRAALYEYTGVVVNNTNITRRSYCLEYYTPAESPICFFNFLDKQPSVTNDHTPTTIRNKCYAHGKINDTTLCYVKDGQIHTGVPQTTFYELMYSVGITLGCVVLFDFLYTLMRRKDNHLVAIKPVQ